MFLANSEGLTAQLEAFPATVKDIVGDVGFLLPELVLSIGVCWVILADVFRKNIDTRKSGLCALTTVIAALAAVVWRGVPDMPEHYMRGMMVADGFGYFFKLIILGGTAICIPMMMMYKGLENRRMGEFYGLLLGSVIGMFLMVSSRNLLMFYLGIEFASITCYLLTAYQKEDRAASEGGMKYVIYGSVASGFMIYGLSFLYGLTGSLDIQTLSQTFVVGGVSSSTLIVAALFSFAGFAYKISAFPMHFWCPDVYQGASLPFTAFLSVISKAAGFAILVRFVGAFVGAGHWNVRVVGGESVHLAWPQILAVASAITMSVGNLAALFQTNMKRLLAYSSIAHAGYLLMGLVALQPVGANATQYVIGWESIAFYLVVYLFMNLGAFLIVAVVSRETGDESIESFRGLSKRSALMAVSFLILLVSLIGIPPTAGFTGKLQLLKAAVDHGYVWLAIVAAANTGISAWYYLRLVKLMFLDETEGDKALSVAPGTSAFVVLLVFPVVYLFVFSSPTVEYLRGLGMMVG